MERQLIEKEETFDGLLQIVKEKDEILNSENLSTLKAEVERLRLELSTAHVTLEQERRLVDQKNAIVQTLEDDKKRVLAERDDAIEMAAQEVRPYFSGHLVFMMLTCHDNHASNICALGDAEKGDLWANYVIIILVDLW